jgi:response regulator RpfG family c-di-GMP phosphodiesterase
MSTDRNLSEQLPNAPVSPVLPLARILIVDDDAVVRDILIRKLAGQDYACESCGDEQTALSFLSSKKFDLVLTGILAPGRGGVALIREAMRISPDIAVVLLTSVMDIEVAVDSLKEGAYDYITKPFSLDEMAIRISRALEKRRLLLENKLYQQTLEEQVASRTGQLKEALGVLERTYHSTLVALSKALDSRDADLAGYSLRVTALAARLAQHLGISEAEIRVIEEGVLLHDIGKIGIPDELLRKPGPLNKNEWCLMHRHPEIGRSILTRIKFLNGAAQLVLHHHERYDGTGYPQHLKGDEINLGARIFAVADAFEGLMSGRPFRAAISVEEAGREIEKMSGAELDPKIVKKFLDIPTSEWKAIRQEIAVNGRRADFLRRTTASDFPIY